MAAKGYVVIYPNPRGSTTYGNNFANVIMNNYPGDDFHDLMDGSLQGCRGAARHRRLGKLVFCIADVAGFHQSFYPASSPFDQPELYKAHSSLIYVNNLKTSKMFILGDADYRTPPTAAGEVFFRALK